MILSNNFAVLTFFLSFFFFFFFLSNFPKHFRVVRYDNHFNFFFFLESNKNCRVGTKKKKKKKNRVCRVSGNTGIFVLGLTFIILQSHYAINLRVIVFISF